jgi:hypothetical protein
MALAIYGNHGALYHNEYIAPTRDGLLSPLHMDDSAEKGGKYDLTLLLDAIEQSLVRRQPVEMADAGGQL